MGVAEITHPFHPLRGECLPILGCQRRLGVWTLHLQTSETRSILVPREWTDQGVEAAPTSPSILDAEALLALADIIDGLRPRRRKRT